MCLDVGQVPDARLPLVVVVYVTGRAVVDRATGGRRRLMISASGEAAWVAEDMRMWDPGAVMPGVSGFEKGGRRGQEWER